MRRRDLQTTGSVSRLCQVQVTVGASKKLGALRSGMLRSSPALAVIRPVHPPPAKTDLVVSIRKASVAVTIKVRLRLTMSFRVDRMLTA
jgi:hypothetical protein